MRWAWRFGVGRRWLWAGMLGVVLVSAALVVRRVRAATGFVTAVCYGDITKPNPVAFDSTNLQFPLTAAKVVPGSDPVLSGVALDTARQPLDPQRIVLPFDQQVTVSYVYRSAAASQSLGWFYFDQVQPYLDASGNLADLDANGIPDFFQNLAPQKVGPAIDGLWHRSAGNPLPDLATGSSYKDGSGSAILFGKTYDLSHYPRLLRQFTSAGNGGHIFMLCDDDGDTNAWPQGAGFAGYSGYLSPVADSSTTSDGIPDYDVNNDGTINAADRTVNLGVIQGGREIVFFAMNYRDNPLNNAGLGLTGGGQSRPPIVPYFTKNILNPDFMGAGKAGTLLQRIAINCARDDSTCYKSKSIAGNPATLGWLDPATITRLATDPAYHGVVLDDTVSEIRVDPNGYAPHFVVNAPSTDPNVWLLAVDNQPEYSVIPGGTYSGCAGGTCSSDADYNDVVFMINRTNGGQVMSLNFAGNIPADRVANTVISKVRLQFKASYPVPPSVPAPGCNDDPNAHIDLFYSLDKVTWRKVVFPSKTQGDMTVDIFSHGLVGNQLFVKAELISASEFCNPVLNSLSVAYEALEHGSFKFAAPIPLVNVAYSGALETAPFPAPDPAPTNNDLTTRGHFVATRLYDPATPSQTAIKTLWDAGSVLASTNPDNRTIFTSVSGNITPFTVAYGSQLYQSLLPPTVRNLMDNGALIYDYTGDGIVNDQDAQFLLEWTRGLEFPGDVTMTPPQSKTARAWLLGAVHNSSPAIVGPPLPPLWLPGWGVPGKMVMAHNGFRQSNAQRATIAVVGAQDGMVHAFDAGKFRYGSDPACTVVLGRGCFAGTTDLERYGSGGERWAFVPPSQLSQLKNDHPFTQSYQPHLNLRSEVDGSISVEDIYVPASNTFKTVAFASLGRQQPFITALDITNPSAPVPLWPLDFADPDFNGTELSPSVGLTTISGGQFMLVTTSGQSNANRDEFVYLVDPLSGNIVQKRKLDTGLDAATSFGFAGYPNLVDADMDGLIDRMYNVDTSGRIFKYDFVADVHCRVGSTSVSGGTPETVYAGMAVDTSGGTRAQPLVKIYVGGGPNPDGTGVVIPGYHLFAFQDNDPVGTCSEGGAKMLYAAALNANEKTWAAPFTANGNVFVATAASAALSICLDGQGLLYQYPTVGDGTSPIYPKGQSPAPPVSITGSPVSSIRVYDGHVFVNTVGGSTTVVGGSNWNNIPPPNSGAGGTANINLNTLMWQER